MHTSIIEGELGSCDVLLDIFLTEEWVVGSNYDADLREHDIMDFMLYLSIKFLELRRITTFDYELD